MPQPLTDLERRILDYLVEYLRSNTYQPSIREIGHQFSIKSTKTVSELLQSLANKGWIERDPSRSRGVRLLGVAMHVDTVTVPCYRDAPLPGSTATEVFELDRKLAGATGVFMFVAQDDSMNGAGIHSGDFLVVEPVGRDSLENGDLVLATADGHRMVRRLVRRGTETALEASAQGYPATVALGPLDISLDGRVTCVIRRLRAPSVPGGALSAAASTPETP